MEGFELNQEKIKFLALVSKLFENGGIITSQGDIILLPQDLDYSEINTEYKFGIRKENPNDLLRNLFIDESNQTATSFNKILEELLNKSERPQSLAILFFAPKVYGVLEELVIQNTRSIPEVIYIKQFDVPITSFAVTPRTAIERITSYAVRNIGLNITEPEVRGILIEKITANQNDTRIWNPQDH